MPDDPIANVHTALAAVMGDLPNIGKGGRASAAQGGYAYRGIEQITKEAAPLMAKHGIVFVPQVVSWEVRDLVVGGKPWTDTILTVKYRICGPGGPEDYIEACVIGIGRDNSDKGANKAMTQAFKYVMIQTFCIADAKDDNDGTTAEADAQDQERVPEGFDSHAEKSDRYNALREVISALAPAEHDEYVAWRDDQGFVFPYTKAMCLAMEHELDRIAEEALARVPASEADTSIGAGPEAPGDSAPRESSETGTDDPAGADEPVIPLPDPGVLEEATAAVAVLGLPEVRDELKAAKLPVSGTGKDQRARLAVHLALNAPPRVAE